MEERLNFRELAARPRVKPGTVRAWQMKGLPCIPAGRLRFYSLTAVEKWLKDQYDAKQQAKMEQRQEHKAAA